MSTPSLALVQDENTNDQLSYHFSSTNALPSDHTVLSPNMNGTFTAPEIKIEPDEMNRASTENSSTMKSPSLPPPATANSTNSIPGRSALDVPPQAASSHSPTPDVYSVKSPPTADRPSMSPTTTTSARNPLASLHSAKRKRLPQDKVGQLEDRIALDARDADAWLALIGEHQAKGKISDARNTYERFFKVFPDLASQWRNYADMELTDGEFKKVEEIFQKCLPVAWTVDMFNFYLDYIRRMNNVLTGGEQARTTISQAYEFVLSIVGIDKDSGTIWSDYLDFVKSSQADAKWKEQQKMDQLRKIYQRAVCLPLENIETLWQQYNAFENDLNKTTARKFVAEKSPAYMQARSALRQMRSIMGGLDRNKIPRPPTWTPPERQELDMWKAWIEWEKTNPLLQDNEVAVYTRVIFAYKQAMMNMRFYPEIWYSAAEYAKSKTRESEATEFMKSGLKANKLSFLLHYQYADHEEGNHNISEVRTTLEALITNIGQEYEKMNKMAEFMKLQLGMEDENDAKMLSEVPDVEREAIVDRQRKRKTQVEMIDREHEIRVERIADDATNAWIALMHAIRRAEGIKSARQIFAKSRKAKPLSHHIFVASAMMEFHSNDDKVIATKVFELGLKTYHDKPQYVLHYLNFLIQINDEPNARALFERTVSKLSPQAARPLFDRFYKYECEYGDTAAIRKLSKRMTDLYPEESNLTRFMHRHTIFGINPIAIHDLPPPIPPLPFQSPPTTAPDDDAASIASSRANSVQPSDIEDVKRNKLDRFGRQTQTRERTNSPDPRTIQKKKATAKRELPAVIMDFLAALPPAHIFDGATFHIDELVKLIRNANVPLPVGFQVNGKRGRANDDDEGPVRGFKKYRDD